jgi:Ni,Fe-hydrogenase III component G
MSSTNDGGFTRDDFAARRPEMPLAYEKMLEDMIGSTLAGHPEKRLAFIRTCWADEMARWSYAYADAMLAARNPQPVAEATKEKQ